jgi:ADP-ribosylglycohydrolase
VAVPLRSSDEQAERLRKQTDGGRLDIRSSRPAVLSSGTGVVEVGYTVVGSARITVGARPLADPGMAAELATNKFARLAQLSSDLGGTRMSPLSSAIKGVKRPGYVVVVGEQGAQESGVRATVARVDVRQRMRACLLAGAVGDALGAPVEFWSIADIRQRLGRNGVTGFIDGAGAVTDDTQMTLFTAEGMIRSSVRARTKGICHAPTVVHHAYLRWLHTQGASRSEGAASSGTDGLDGWLVAQQRLHHRRAPGTTCLSALRSGEAGSVDRPINNSKGCGGVMRAAPVGLFIADPEEAFRLGCEIAALTHGHPSGWLPAGVLAGVISMAVNGAALDSAFEACRRMLVEWPGHEETLRALDRATEMAAKGIPSPEHIERLGGAWVGEEALAIAACCALATDDPTAAVLAAVNHSGDSDSTGAICGNLLGAVHGRAACPSELVASLDIGDIVLEVADDLWRERFDPPSGDGGNPTPEWWARYPGW